MKKAINKTAVILDLIKSSKGVTIADIAKAVTPDITKQYVYTIVGNLTKKGLIRKNGKVYVGKRAYNKKPKPVSVYDDDGVNVTNTFNTPPRDPNVDHLIQRISNLEVILAEKEKEVWTLECEVFDKKAVISYLENKLIKG